MKKYDDDFDLDEIEKQLLELESLTNSMKGLVDDMERSSTESARFLALMEKEASELKRETDALFNGGLRW